MLQVSINIDRARLDEIEQALLDQGALSLTLQDAADHAVLEPLPGETPLWPQLVITALFSEAVEIESLRQSLHEVLGDSSFSSRPLPERDWTRIWLDHFKPMRFGHRLRVLPNGHDDAAEPAAVSVRLEPGLAFGTGTHPTTALCLEWLDAHPPIAAAIIDYGCGSGILAIAALKLGARHVRAVDIDAQALCATRANAKRNDISHRRLHTCRPEALSRRPADLVIANILANPLIELAGLFAERVKSGGRIVLSGLLDRQIARVSAAYAQHFALAVPRATDGWVLLEGTRV
jgi:ribosomal protein L11 methyltransferase